MHCHRNFRWLGYGERTDAKHPDRIYIAIYSGAGRSLQPALVLQGKVAKRGGRVLARRHSRLRHYHAAYYGAFLRDPDGNKVEAVCHRAV